MTCSLSFSLQMSEPITHMDTDNCMTIHRKRTSYFDCTAHLMCFVPSFKGNKLSFIVIIVAERISARLRIEDLFSQSTYVRAYVRTWGF